MRGTALIVEDDEDLRVVLSILLTTEGWTVASAASLQEAEAQLHDLPDLLVVEVSADGSECGDLLARLACRADAPVTLLVGTGGEPRILALAKKYGVAHAGKPLEVEELMHAADVAVLQARRPGHRSMRSTWPPLRPSMPSLA